MKPAGEPPPSSITWRVPFTWNAQEAKQSVKATFPPIVIARLLGVYVLIFALTKHLILNWLPELEFHWTKAFWGCLLILVLMIGSLIVSAFIPPVIKICPGGIFIQFVSTGTLVAYKAIQNVTLERSDTGYWELVFMKENKPKVYRYPLSSKLTVVQVEQSLAENRQWYFSHHQL